MALGFRDVLYYKVKNIEDKEYSVRGTWELQVAEKLNELGIKWIRNHILKYRRPDESKERFYNPDFYLPNEDVFIEVKGYYSEKDKEKMEYVLLYNPNAKIKMIFQKELKMLMNNSIELAQISFLSL